MKERGPQVIDKSVIDALVKKNAPALLTGGKGEFDSNGHRPEDLLVPSLAHLASLYRPGDQDAAANSQNDFATIESPVERLKAIWASILFKWQENRP